MFVIPQFKKKKTRVIASSLLKPLSPLVLHQGCQCGRGRMLLRLPCPQPCECRVHETQPHKASKPLKGVRGGREKAVGMGSEGE